MPNPWDNNYAHSASLQKNPWEAPDQVNAAHDLPTHAATPMRLEEKMPEGVKEKDRLLVANFANDPQTAAEWLRTKYPDMDIGLVNGRIAMRKKGDPGNPGVLIPDLSVSDLFTSPTAVVQKIGDHLADVTKGIGSTTAAGMAAAPAAIFGPVAATGAGMVAGAATNAGLETARQGIGKALGINKELNPSEIALEGGVGAAAPLAFGAGEEAPGLIRAAYNSTATKVLPKVGEMMSGKPAATILHTAQNIDQLKSMEKNGITDFVNQTHEGIVKPLQDAADRAGTNMRSAMENAGVKVNIDPARQEFENVLAKLEKHASDYNTPNNQKSVEQMSKFIKEYFYTPPAEGETVGQPIHEASASTAMDLKQKMKDFANFENFNNYDVQSSLSGMNPAQRQITSSARGAYHAIDKGIMDAVDATDKANGLEPGNYASLKNQYKDAKNIQENIQPYFNTPQKTMSTLQSLGSKNKRLLFENLADVDQKYGTSVLDAAKTADMYNSFAKPSLMPVSSGGVTSTSRSVPLAGAGAAGMYMLGRPYGLGLPSAFLGGLGGSTLGSPAAMRGYMALGRGINSAADFLGPANLAVPLSAANATITNNQLSPSPWTLFPPKQ